MQIYIQVGPRLFLSMQHSRRFRSTHKVRFSPGIHLYSLHVAFQFENFSISSCLSDVGLEVVNYYLSTDVRNMTSAFDTV